MGAYLSRSVPHGNGVDYVWNSGSLTKGNANVCSFASALQTGERQHGQTRDGRVLGERHVLTGAIDMAVFCDTLENIEVLGRDDRVTDE